MRRDVLVAVVMDPSPELVVAVLAVLKAGGALVPLDPASPTTAALLDDAQPPLLLAEPHLLAALPPVDAEILCPADLGPALDAEPADDPTDAPDPEALAYVRHTAGTTGRPKAALVTHAAAGARLLRTRETWDLDATDRVLHAAPSPAGTAPEELLRPLTAGATLVLTRRPGHDDPAHLARTLHDEGVTALRLTPSTLDLLLAEPGTELPTGLRRVLCGGEALPTPLRERFAARSRARLHHLYGTVETGDVPTDGGTVPAGVRALVLDRFGTPVPAGVPGELHIGGPGLAHGYLDRPDLDDEHLTDGPASAPGRLHRTGDLARLRADGTPELLGRAADRATVRGFRADTARIEAELARHADVRRAVVTARPRPDGRTRLVAHVVPAGPRPPAPDDLTAHLARHLPDYLVPAAVVVLPALPLTADGRVDQDALPAPDDPAAHAEPSYTAPRDALERSVAEAWQDLLGVERVGAHDDFFDLGGHSLLMTRLATRLGADHGVRVPLRDLFDHTTVARMAAYLAARTAEGSTDAAPAPVPVADRSGPLPLSFAQEELVLHQPVPAEDPFHNVLTALALRGTLDEPALRGALDDIVRRHEALRSRVVADGPGRPVQLTAAADTWPVTHVDLRSLDDTDRAAALRALIKEEEHRPFRIAEEPLVRATLVRLADDEHVLVQVIHHLVTDNWSYGVLFDEMSAFYRARVTGTEPRPTPLPAQFADVAAWQQRQLADGALEEDLAHWRRELAELPPTLRFTAPAHQAGSPATGAAHGFTVDAGVADALADLGRQEGATLFMVLLAAYDVLLAAYSGGDDIPVDFPVAGRERPETHALIGYFVNHLVVRADLSGPLTFRDLLRQVRERTLAAYAHQSAPLWALDGVVTDGHDPAAVSFNLLNATVPALDLPGLTVAPLDQPDLGDDYVFPEVVVDFEASAVDLALIMRQDDTGTLRGMWLHALDHLDARAVGAMTRRWPRLLDAVTAGPDRPVADLRQLLLAPEEG